jgi:hypothetical protein
MQAYQIQQTVCMITGFIGYCLLVTSKEYCFVMDAMLLFSPNQSLTIGFFRYGFPLIFLIGGGYCCGYFYILNGGHYMTFDIGASFYPHRFKQTVCLVAGFVSACLLSAHASKEFLEGFLDAIARHDPLRVAWTTPTEEMKTGILAYIIVVYYAPVVVFLWMGWWLSRFGSELDKKT